MLCLYFLSQYVGLVANGNAKTVCGVDHFDTASHHVELSMRLLILDDADLVVAFAVPVKGVHEVLVDLLGLGQPDDWTHVYIEDYG